MLTKEDAVDAHALYPPGVVDLGDHRHLGRGPEDHPGVPVGAARPPEAVTVRTRRRGVTAERGFVLCSIQ